MADPNEAVTATPPDGEGVAAAAHDGVPGTPPPAEDAAAALPGDDGSNDEDDDTGAMVVLRTSSYAGAVTPDGDGKQVVLPAGQHVKVDEDELAAVVETSFVDGEPKKVSMAGSDSDSDADADVALEEVTIPADLLELVLATDVADDVPYGELDELPSAPDGTAPPELVRPMVLDDGKTVIVVGKEGSATLTGLEDSSLFPAIANLCNTILGAGMLGLPAAFAGAGYAIGTILLVLAGVGTFIGLHLLVECQNTVGIYPSSLYIVANAVAPSLTILVDLIVVVNTFGVGTAYLIVVGDLMPDAMDHWGGMADRTVWITIGWAICIPLCFLRTLDALKHTSTFAVLCVFAVTLFVIAYATGIWGYDPCLDVEGTCRGDRDYPVGSATGPLKSFSVFVLAFSCAQNIFAVISELKNATPVRVSIVTTTAISVSAVVYFTVAVAGFLTYGDEVEGNILKSYPSNTNAVSVVRILVTLLVIFSYPLQCHPARRSLLGIHSAIRARWGKSIVTSDTEFYAITVAFLIFSYIIALSLNNLGVVLQLIGATCSTSITFIIPGFVYWKLHPKPHRTRNIAALIGIVGCLIVPLAVTMIFV